jgi:hypothetical protein
VTTIAQIKAWAEAEAAKAPPEHQERVRQEYIGSAIADSCFCPCCGARGFFFRCPECSLD